MMREYSLQVQCGEQQGQEIKVKKMRREEHGGGSIKSCSEDVLFEVLKHLDSKSLAIAACVSRRWKRAAEEEALWEGICAKHWPEEVLYASQSGQLRSVVLALGGFRRLYVYCLRPLLDPLHHVLDQPNKKEWSKDQVHLSLSLFSIDCYERLGRRSNCPTSLRFLCKPSHHLTSSTSSSSSFSLYKGAPSSSTGL